MDTVARLHFDWLDYGKGVKKMHEARAIDFGVGLFILLGLISVLFLVVQTIDPSRMNSDDSYVLEARFDHVGDLKVRAPVALAGCA